MLTLYILFAILVGGFAFGTLLLRHCAWIDKAEALGLGAIVAVASIGAFGLLTAHLVGDLSISRWSYGLILVISILILAFLHWRSKIDFKSVSVKFEPKKLVFVAPFLILTWFIWQKVTGPFDMFDWDTMAYHFSVLQMWLRAGSMPYIPTIHHSNFPFLVEFCAYPGVAAGDMIAAKSMTLWFFLAACLWIFGLARRLLGVDSAWWAFLVFSSCPLAVMNSGSGYIDLAHGLFSAIGLIYAIEWAIKPERDSRVWLVAFGLWASLSSKYTGLQIAAVSVIAILFLLGKAKSMKSLGQLALPAVLCLTLASPTYIRNYQNTGTPVYPFFYEVFHGRNWDQWRADIYRDEQQTFGVGRAGNSRDKTAFGHAIYSLAYQPGRFINPGQDSNYGLPIGAVGVALVLAFVFSFGWIGNDKLLRALVSSSLGILVLWFLLSQQSRYMLSLAPIFALLFGALVSKPNKLQNLLKVTAVLQAIYTIALFHFNGQSILDQINRASAKTPQEQQNALVPLSGMEKRWFDATDKNSIFYSNAKVALFDEVFGIFLTVNYYWANPGHSMYLPYESMRNGDDFAKALKETSTTYVYLNQFSVPREPSPEELATTGKSAEELLTIDQAIRRLVLARLKDPKTRLADVTTRTDFTNPNPDEVMKIDLRVRWKFFLLQAFDEGKIQLLPYPDEPDMTLRGPFFKVVESKS